jgi:hypothetical protein
MKPLTAKKLGKQSNSVVYLAKYDMIVEVWCHQRLKFMLHDQDRWYIKGPLGMNGQITLKELNSASAIKIGVIH